MTIVILLGGALLVKIFVGEIFSTQIFARMAFALSVMCASGAMLGYTMVVASESIDRYRND
jgi:hypothetical protein